MNDSFERSRRDLLKTLALGTVLIPAVQLASSRAAAALREVPLQPDDRTARARHYVEDAKQSALAPAGRTCANCMLYQGDIGSTQGPCTLFPGKLVKAVGWCDGWAPQM